MKRFVKFLFVTAMLPALAAGIFFCGGMARRVPRGVTVNGVDVGGMTRPQAVACVREDVLRDLRARELKICVDGNVYSYSYPEISFKDDARRVVYSAVRAGNYALNLSWYLNGIDAVVSGICAAEYAPLREPEAVFNGGDGEPFEYIEGSRGKAVDCAALKSGIERSLSLRRYGEEFEEVLLQAEYTYPKGSIEYVKKRTARLAVFTTYFDCENTPRVSNIRLAGERISGCILGAGKIFSFNARVGVRTQKNGFQRAKIIEDGRFVYGVGGGVCQVSTTLYNAALLAGLDVTEYHPHSLAVNYVRPSRDAMVSGTYSDLKFRNVTNCPVYIRILTGLYYVRCEIYGLSDGTKYSLDSRVTGGEDGAVESECYLTATRGEESVTKLIRKDRYLPAKT